MKTYFRYFIILALLFGYQAESFAQEVESCALDDERTVIIFSNGMFNDIEDDVWDSMMTVSRTVRSLPSDPLSGLSSEDIARFRYTYVHNKNELLPIQLIEVGIQRTSEEVSAFLGWLRGLVPKPQFLEDALDIFPFVRDKIQQITDADLSDHISTYEKYLTEGTRVIVVAHSQGNIYANRAYREIERRLPDRIGSLHIIGVATPVKSDNGPYVTLEEDKIIDDFVGVFFPSTPDDNAHNTNETGDFSGHQFVESYIKGNDSGKKIKGLLADAIKKVKFPDPLVSQGIITVALTWDNQPDVDLHVIEPAPDSTHVYYANLQGISGTLDRDDTNGVGPEHYVVDCEDVKTGTYLIGGNYFRGSAPTDTTFKISAARDSATIRHRFTKERGISGDNDFKNIARITVRKDSSSGKFFFDIREFP